MNALAVEADYLGAGLEKNCLVWWNWPKRTETG